MFMKKNLLVVVAVLATFYACGVKSAQKTGDATTSTTVSADHAKGKELYTAKCGKCHPAFEVKTKSVERWEQVLKPMIEDKAKMTPADGKLVEAYVWSELGVKGK